MRVQRRGDNAHEWELYRGKGRIGIEWYFKESTALPVSAMMYRLEPGTEEGQHFHREGDAESCSPTRTEDEIYIVTSGELVMTQGEDARRLKAGDAFYAPAGTRHGVRNDSDDPAEMILLFGPPGHHPFPQSGKERFDVERN